MKKITWRSFVFSVLSLLASGLAFAQAQLPPIIKIYVAYPAGGASDSVARLLGDRLSRSLNRPVVIENRAGADGVIAMDAVAKAPKDGSVIGFSAISPFTITAHIRKLPFEAKSVVPLVQVMYSPGLLVGTSATTANTLAELLAQAKQKPGAVRWGNSGSVSLSSLLLEQLKADSGADIISVPYKGGSQLLMDALGGQFEIMAINAAPSVLQSVKQGKLRVLAVTSPSRLDSLPNVPTLAELGHPSANLISIFGLFIPAGVPESTAKELTSAVGKILADPEIKSGIADTGNVLMAGSSAEFASRIASESLVNERIIKRGGIKAE